ncbi:MAG: division/cell wall cluster transcriptional repressor MraZ [Thermodesulfovibrionia bacterium]|nr:division/cell wall cluster transcriptional repressor MraZ [Thermodesulfovibrionia bacterium]
MSSFLGKYYNTLDPKGRIIIPAPFREILSSAKNTKLIIANDAFDHCLCAYPVEEWGNLVGRVKDKPQTMDSVKYFMRRVVGSAVECELDKQGRIQIPSALRVDAGLSSEVVVMGQGNKIEIWEKNALEVVADPTKIDKNAFKKELSDLGI